MSARWSVTIWHALADFDGAEQEFLFTLWDEVFSPLQGLENYDLEDQLRERFRGIKSSRGPRAIGPLCTRPSGRARDTSRRRPRRRHA